MVIKDRVVVAVEAVEGTDEAIKRGGKLAKDGAVVVKRCKPQQDLRFDLPAIGPRTIDIMASVKASVLAVEAGRTIVLDRDLTLAEGAVGWDRGRGTGPSQSERRIITLSDTLENGCDRRRASRPTSCASLCVTARIAPGRRRGSIGRTGSGDRGPSQCSYVYPSIDELLPQIDVVSIAVPTSAHFAVAKACLLAGKHVLVEKPMAVTPAEAQELVRLAAQHNCRLQVGHSERFNPVMQVMRPHIGRPVFIECHRLSSFSERGTDVDVVLDLDDP